MSATLPDVLARIAARRRERYGVQGRRRPEETSGEWRWGSQANPFVDALTRRRGRAVIAEVKLGSPRLGDISSRIDPERQAEVYARAGAAALSVVVEPDFFYGSFDLLAAARAASGLPAIAKDFVVHERQLDEAAAAGADAVLLVAALYADAGELVEWADAARQRGLAPLVETHDAADLERVAAAVARGAEPWELVGVNNRDLRTFDVDLERAIALRPRLPASALAVAESGIGSGADVARLRAAGFDAFLVGESLLLADDPEAKLRELLE